MPTSQDQAQRIEKESQIKNEFSEMQKSLDELKKKVDNGDRGTKKQENLEELQRLEKEASDLKSKIDIISSLSEQELQLLNEQDLQSLKAKLSQTVQESNGESSEISNNKIQELDTYKLLEGSETVKRLLTIISSNSQEFANLQGDTPEAKLEYLFSKIHDNVIRFLKNKLGETERYDKIINSTMAPAFEWSMMEMLKSQGNEKNVSMLEKLNNISLGSFQGIADGVENFASAKTTGKSFNKFSQRVNALDYLSVHNQILNEPEKSAVLTNPVEFKNYLNNPIFDPKDQSGNSISFSPYNPISENIFKIDENQKFEFGITPQEKQDVLNQIGNIQVADNPETTKLITKMINKSEIFFQTSKGVQSLVNGVLDGANALNSVTKIVGIDLLGEITRPPEERGFWYRIVDFVCKLIGITGGLEGIVGKWRLDRLNLTSEKNENITKIFEEYQKIAGKGSDLSITDANSCSSALADLTLTDLDKSSTTKGDYLRDVMADNMDINLISTSVVQQTLGDDYLKKEIVTVNGKQQEKVIVDTSKITEEKKKELTHKHITNMKIYLESNFNDLKDFYSNIHNIDDLVVCMTASLYADKEDVIEGVKAKVFLPENYGVIYGGAVGNGSGNENGDNNGDSSGDTNGGEDGNSKGDNEGSENYSSTLSDLTPDEKSEMDKLVDQSKSPNAINYLENSTYKKYLNVIERDLKLPRYALECVCKQESGGKLYKGSNLLGSSAGAKGLFQFIDGTADKYMKDSKLGEKYGKIFNSRDDFLRDPLATAWAAGIMLSENMEEYGSFQSALACYNCGPGRYKERIGEKTSLASGDLGKLPKETRNYVELIAKDILQHNSASSSDIFTDLGQYSWG